jgi:hypothetical protein
MGEGPAIMSRFGEYLRKCGALDDAEFEVACQSQVAHGGRIGSVLVELGYMQPEDLAKHLSNYHGIPIPSDDWLETPDECALKLIPNMLVRRYHVLPLRIEAKRIHVVMLDPIDQLQLRLIAEMAKRPVTPYVLPELRLLYWLEKHCGIIPHPRYANLSVRVRCGRKSEEAESESDFQPLGEGEALASESFLDHVAPNIPLTPLIASGDQKPFDELLLEEIVLVDEVSSGGEPQLLSVPSGPGEIAALEFQLQGAIDRNAVIDLGIRLASAFAPSAALFIVRSNLVAGHHAAANGVITPLDTVLLPSDTPSIFTEPALTGQPFRGRPPHDGMDGRILTAIGRPDAHEVLVLPVVLRGRVVNLLYADNGPDALPDTSVAALRAVGTTMAAAYERLILESKLDS